MAGEAIALPARILSVAESYDMATHNRGQCTESVKAAIRKEAGTAFDPAVVDAFEASFDRLSSMTSQLSEGCPVVAGAVSFLA